MSSRERPWAATPSIARWDAPVAVEAGARVGSALRAAGFTATSLDEHLGPLWTKPALQPIESALARLGDAPLAVLVALLLAGQPRRLDEVARAGLDPADLVALELAEVDGDLVTAAFRVEPWQGLLVASDPPVAGRVDDSFVLGPSISGGRCADLTPRRPVARALDVGAGGGLQALLLAAHAGSVVGTDVNPRALWLARRNAALNGVANVEWRLGSWLDPVGDEQFPLVVCNAPFVVTPGGSALYLDGGVAGGGVSELLARTLPRVLADGGLAMVMASWVAGDDDPVARPRAWFERFDGAALLLTLRRLAPDEHARTWADVSVGDGGPAAALQAWADGLRALGARHVHEGAFVLQRRARGPRWVDHLSLAADEPNPAGEHVLRLIAGADLLHSLEPGAEVVDQALVAAPTVRLHQVVTAERGAHDERAELRMTDGIAPIGHLDPITVAALPRLAHAPTARVAVREAALAAGAPPGALDELEAQATEVVRDLVRFGVLVAREKEKMPPCPVSSDSARVRAARAAFDALGYDDARVRDTLGLGPGGALDLPDPAAAQQRVDPDTALGAAVWLFALELDLAADDAAAALGDALAVFMRAGLAELVGDDVRATVRVVPYQHLLLASDRSDVDGDERVPGPFGTAHLLTLVTPREHVARALDLGTGGGVQALLLADHADAVVASDVVPRALDYARANAALNGIDNVSWRLGSWLEPVAGERFDLVVANPPLVISPEARYRYRDGEGGSDEVSRAVVALLPDALVEGGIGVTTIGWVQPVDEAAPAPERWLAGTAVDAWVLVHELQSAERSAEAWNAPLRADLGAYLERVDAWVRHFDALGVSAVGYGAVAVRRRHGATGVVGSLKVSAASIGPAGAQVARMLRAAELLDGISASGLLDLTVVLSDEARVVETWGAAPVARSVRLRTEGSLGADLGLDAAAGVLLSLLTEPATVRSAVVAAARRLDLSPDAAAPAALGVVEALLRYGLLVAVEPG